MRSSEPPSWVVFRMVQPPHRRGLFRVDPPEYELSTGCAEIRRVTLDQLPESLGVPPEGSRRDWQECEMTASRLYREGRRESWVHYPTTQIVDKGENFPSSRLL